MQGTSSAHAWADLPSALSTTLPEVNSTASSDGQLKAFITSDAIVSPAVFGIKAAGSNNCVLVTVSNGKCEVRGGDAGEAKPAFVLSALPEQWEQFFKQTPVAPYQSYWGMYGMNIKQSGIEVEGDQSAFAHWTHVWRRILELIHDTYAGPTPEDAQEESDEDVITGHYVVLKDIPVWGRSKCYYETAGTGPIPIVFLHT